MRALRANQRRKQAGFIVSVELMFITVILIIGLIVGWIYLRNAVIAELWDTGQAIGHLDQSYSFTGTNDPVAGPTSALNTEGSTYDDEPDGPASGFDDNDGVGDAGDGNINVDVAPVDHETGHP